ncbi:MAG: hypothetical protein Q9M91_03665 [Candidatus Dojkabacteria bacterium]|nr:hypothetical protein [Candidatus Dojkabacteria bacterium]MDQ7020914.1 hypothetical protein [Candidatus Dojkabacteria bacterium]
MNKDNIKNSMFLLLIIILLSILLLFKSSNNIKENNNEVSTEEITSNEKNEAEEDINVEPLEEIQDESELATKDNYIGDSRFGYSFDAGDLADSFFLDTSFYEYTMIYCLSTKDSSFIDNFCPSSFATAFIINVYNEEEYYQVALSQAYPGILLGYDKESGLYFYFEWNNSESNTPEDTLIDKEFVNRMISTFSV